MHFSEEDNRWPTGTWKDAQYHQSLGKHKSKSQYHLTLFRRAIIKKN